jgi:iron(III) transport system substrate-binding protein
MALGVCTTILAAAPAALAKDKLTFYCSAQDEWCQLVANEFQDATGIDVAMTRKSSGETFAQVKAEA